MAAKVEFLKIEIGGQTVNKIPKNVRSPNVWFVSELPDKNFILTKKSAKMITSCKIQKHARFRKCSTWDIAIRLIRKKPTPRVHSTSGEEIFLFKIRYFHTTKHRALTCTLPTERWKRLSNSEETGL